MLTTKLENAENWLPVKSVCYDATHHIWNLCVGENKIKAIYLKAYRENDLFVRCVYEDGTKETVIINGHYVVVI